MKKSFALIGLMMTTALPAFAQETPAPPAMFAGAEGLAYQGRVGNIDYWAFEPKGSVDYVIGSDSESGAVSVGYLFDKDGKDISAQLTGSPALTVEDFGGPSADSGADLAEDDDLTPLVAEPGLEEHDNQLLENASETVRNELLATLVGRLEATTTRQEYQDVILKWREEVRETLSKEARPEIPQDLIDMLSQSKDSAPEEGSEENASEIDAAETPAPVAEPEAADIDGEELSSNNGLPPNPVTSLMPTDRTKMDQKVKEANGEALPFDEMSDLIGDLTKETAFETLSQGSRWFSLGSLTAPVVYMVADPTCPYCSRAFADLRPHVEAGEVQLRIIMAPLLTDKSMETIAGIMLSETPGETLFENAEARAGLGGTPVRARNATDLPDDVRNDLLLNRQNIANLGIRQIPHFTWLEETGVKDASGVVAFSTFENALPDTDGGEK